MDSSLPEEYQPVVDIRSNNSTSPSILQCFDTPDHNEAEYANIDNMAVPSVVRKRENNDQNLYGNVEDPEQEDSTNNR